MEADLQRFYGIALSDLTVGKLSYRRLGVLVRQLPKESALARAQYGSEVDWGLAEHLQALTVDAISAGNWQRAVASGVKPKPKPPKPLPRPGVDDGTTRIGKTHLSHGEVAAFLSTFDPPKEAAPDGN